jgi:hypothetical protein
MLAAFTYNLYTLKKLIALQCATHLQQYKRYALNSGE